MDSEKRLNDLEENQKEIFNRLNIIEKTYGILNEKLDNIKETQKDLKDSIRELQASIKKLSEEPGRRYDNLITAGLTATITGVVAFFIGKFTGR
jgi:septation ring formation regulator EzrA